MTGNENKGSFGNGVVEALTCLGFSRLCVKEQSDRAQLDFRLQWLAGLYMGRS